MPGEKEWSVAWMKSNSKGNVGSYYFFIGKDFWWYYEAGCVIYKHISIYTFIDGLVKFEEKTVGNTESIV